MKFSRKQIISFIIISILIAAIPPTLYLLQQRQILKSKALEPTAWCTPDDNSIPGGYSYIPGALEIYVSVIEADNSIGPIPGVYLRADMIENNKGTGVNAPRNSSDGPGCGFSAQGITGASGHVNLEPLNCNHNNFKVSNIDPEGIYPGGLPGDVEFDSTASTFQPDGNNQSNVFTPDISNLPLDNGYAGILKLYYKRKPSQSIPTPSPTPTPTPSPTPTSTLTPTPAPTPTPTSSCPVPNTVTNIRIECPYCP